MMYRKDYKINLFSIKCRMIFVVVATQIIQLVYAGPFFLTCSTLGGTPYAKYDNGVELQGSSGALLGAVDCDFSKLSNPGDCLECSEVCRKTASACPGTNCNNIQSAPGVSAAVKQALGELFDCAGYDDGTYFSGCPAAGSETPITTQRHCIASDGSLTSITTAFVGAGAGAILLTAAPSGLGLFGGAGFLGQPGITLGGGGILPAAAFTNAVVLAEVVGLVSGLTGAAIISIFSTELGETSFLVPRTVPATAVIFSEPDPSIPRTSISRASTPVNDKTTRDLLIGLRRFLARQGVPEYITSDVLKEFVRSSKESIEREYKTTPDFKRAVDGASCNMPILDVGQKIKDISNVAESTLHKFYNGVYGSATRYVNKKYTKSVLRNHFLKPLLTRAHNNTHKLVDPVLNNGFKVGGVKYEIDRVTQLWDLAIQKLSMAKASFYEKLGLSCLVPRLLQPWVPIFDYARCQLGIKDDFMEAPICNRTLCTDSEIEEREITNDNGMQNMGESALEVNTVDDCIPNMKKVTYGVRVLAKLIDDVSCDDPEYKEECDSLIAEQRIVEEETCQLPSCKGVNDDPFTPCFQCEDVTSRSDLPHYAYSYIDRQSGEKFQVTRPSRRVVCRRGPAGRRRCRLRVSRAMQLRQSQYGPSLQFVQAEQYLSTDDLDIVRYYVKLKRYLLKKRL